MEVIVFCNLIMKVTFHHLNCILFIINESPGPTSTWGTWGRGLHKGMDTQRQGSLGTNSEPAYHTLFPGKPARQHFPVPQGQSSDWVLATEHEHNEISPFPEAFLLSPARCMQAAWPWKQHVENGWTERWKYKLLNQKLNNRRRYFLNRNTLLDLRSAESHLL